MVFEAGDCASNAATFEGQFAEFVLVIHGQHRFEVTETKTETKLRLDPLSDAWIQVEFRTKEREKDKHEKG